MHMKQPETGVSRRDLLGTAAAGLVALVPGTGVIQSRETARPARKASTVRDHLWIFTVFAGGDNDSLEAGGYRGGSRMTPAEGAFWLNVPNLLIIRSSDKPPLPSTEKGRAKTSFEQWAISFQPLDRVVWSIVGSGGKGRLGELDPVIQLARDFPNISGIYLDDFIVDFKKRSDGRLVGRPALSPSELKAAREKMKSLGRPLDIWITLYRSELLPHDPHYLGCDPPLASFIDLFDVLTLWTWNSDELPKLEESLAALESIAPKTARKALGLYTWDFTKKKPVPLELMRYQCELGLKWLKAGRIHEMIFLANTTLDVGLPSAEFARQWIAKVGSQELK
jgi:hypothetical protein